MQPRRGGKGRGRVEEGGWTEEETKAEEPFPPFPKDQEHLRIFEEEEEQSRMLVEEEEEKEEG